MHARFVRRIVYPTPTDTETLFYFLLEDTPADSAPGSVRYGVRVLEVSSVGTLLSQETVLNVTSDRFLIMQILTMLIDGSVSPCVLRDIVEDLVAVG